MKKGCPLSCCPCVSNQPEKVDLISHKQALVLSVPVDQNGEVSSFPGSATYHVTLYR